MPLRQPTTCLACHACLFLPETSCERGNKYLDHSVLVSTVESGELAFFTKFAEAVPEATITAETDESVSPPRPLASYLASRCLPRGDFGGTRRLLGGFGRGFLLGRLGRGASAPLALAVLIASLVVRAGPARPAGAEDGASCLRAKANGQILRSSQRGQSGSPSTHVSLARSSIRSRNSAPRFLGTARSRTARRAGSSDSEIPSRIKARREALSIGIAWPPSACWMTVAVT